MFRALEYKLIILILLLITFVAISCYLFINQSYPIGILSTLCTYFFSYKIYNHVRKQNKNIIFLLNALNNGDYSFSFHENAFTKSEKELNKMLNEIKLILSRARENEIENEKFLSQIIEIIPTGVIILNEYNNIHLVNQTATNLLGLPVFTHLNQLSSINEDLPTLFKNIQYSQNKQIEITTEHEKMQISVRCSSMKSKRGEIKVITLNNINSELEAKEMESWIRLIRVMTHEIMNSIAPITSLSETLLFALKSKKGAEENNTYQTTIDGLETIGSTAKGLTTFVNSYREFTGIPKPQLHNLNIIPIIRNIILLLSTSYTGAKDNIIKFVPETEILEVNADENLIGQVFINLIKNAMEVVAENPDEQIIIKTGKDASNTYIDICNNGEAIPEDIIPHIFVPFFTTKDSGSGIGLSISKHIMRMHGGNLKHFRENGWTIFRIIL